MRLKSLQTSRYRQIFELASTYSQASSINMSHVCLPSCTMLHRGGRGGGENRVLKKATRITAHDSVKLPLPSALTFCCARNGRAWKGAAHMERPGEMPGSPLIGPDQQLTGAPLCPQDRPHEPTRVGGCALRSTVRPGGAAAWSGDIPSFRPLRCSPFASLGYSSSRPLNKQKEANTN